MGPMKWREMSTVERVVFAAAWVGFGWAFSAWSWDRPWPQQLASLAVAVVVAFMIRGSYELLHRGRGRNNDNA